MPTLASLWNGKSLKPAQSRYGQGISSSDLALGSEDAYQLHGPIEPSTLPPPRRDSSEEHDLPPPPPITKGLSTSHLHVANTKDSDMTSARLGSSYHMSPSMDPLAEFGGVSRKTSQQNHNGHSVHHNRYATEPKMLPSKSIPIALSSATTKRSAGTATDVSTSNPHPFSYGYTALGWDTQMDVTKAAEIILVCGEQIRARGLDSPLIFSSMALDLSAHNVSSLLKSLTQTPSMFLSTDVAFASPHDLAAIIKWALARLGRVFQVPIPPQETHKKGNPPAGETVLVQQRGFLDWDEYTKWSSQEKSNRYSINAFSTFLGSLPSSSAALLVALFSLLSSTTSYSHKNGMTPSRLSRLFGSLLFGLPEDETFERTYEAYVRASNATEHLLLSYIRDAGTIETLPTRLADHVRGYPAMLSTDINKPSRSVLGAPCTHINRNVRLYSLDLVQTACELDMTDPCIEWQACCSNDDVIGKDPQLSDRYRKLINLRGGRKQGRGQGAPPDMNVLGPYTSLSDKQWGDFLHEGFSPPDESKLAFDLRESERRARSHRPGDVQWSQFEKSGFVMADDGLASVLSFDDGLRDDMQRWPAERAELLERLRKTAKQIPDFPYDTTPYIVSSPTLDASSTGQWNRKPVSRFDEVFAEVYADVLLGNGWSNRDEQTHRTANFAVVQYRSRPTPSTVGSQGAGASSQTRGVQGALDDRIDAAWFIVEEMVPAHYRSEMEAAGRPKTRSRATLRKLNVFKRRKEENPSSLTGSKGGAADSISAFEELLKPGLGGVTKRLHLGRDPAAASPNLARVDSGSTIRATRPSGDGDEVAGAAGSSGSGLRLMKSLRTKTKQMQQRRDDRAPSPPPKPSVIASPSFSSDDFETRSLHDPELEAMTSGPTRRRSVLKNLSTNTKRQSKDDNWLDVMIRANGFRMAGQDAEASQHSPMAGNSSVRTPMPAIPRRGSSTPTAAIQIQQPSNDDSTNLPIPPRQSSTTPSAPDAAGLGLQLTDTSPSLSGAAAPVRRKPSPKMDEAEEERESQVSRDSLQAAGWTYEGSAPDERSPSVPAKSPQRGSTRSGENETSPSTSPLLTYLKDQLDASESTESKEEEEEARSPARSAYLKALPSRATEYSSDERERAREARIQAAKDRARELRANLNPVAVQELDQRKTQSPTLIKPTPSLKSPYRPQVSSDEPSTPSSSKDSPSAAGTLKTPPKDDPFAKDRISGRVASVASKFGGGTIKPITPQSTGNSLKAAASPTRIASGGNSGPLLSVASTTATAAPAPSFSSQGNTSASNPRHSTASTASSLLEDPYEPHSRHSMESSALIGDGDSIYPEDAASNFSPEMNGEEETQSLPRGPGYGQAAIRPGGSIAAMSPSMASAFSPDLGRKEEEDEAMEQIPSFRVPYQPGMPLSNLEEESESMLSGSNA